MNSDRHTPARPEWDAFCGKSNPEIEHYRFPDSPMNQRRWASVLDLSEDNFTVYLWGPGMSQPIRRLTTGRKEARKIAENWVNRDPALQ